MTFMPGGMKMPEICGRFHIAASHVDFERDTTMKTNA
jgi:hypothetical protein